MHKNELVDYGKRIIIYLQNLSTTEIFLSRCKIKL